MWTAIVSGALSLWSKVKEFVYPILIGVGAVLAFFWSMARREQKAAKEAIQRERAEANAEAEGRRSQQQGEIDQARNEAREEAEDEEQRDQKRHDSGDRPSGRFGDGL